MSLKSHTESLEASIRSRVLEVRNARICTLIDSVIVGAGFVIARVLSVEANQATTIPGRIALGLGELAAGVATVGVAKFVEIELHAVDASRQALPLLRHDLVEAQAEGAAMRAVAESPTGMLVEVADNINQN